MVAVSKTTTLRSFGFKIELTFAILYTVYIDLKLLHSVLGGFVNESYYIFGVHLTRSMLATTFSHWAYELFVAHGAENEILYNFTQQSPGNRNFVTIFLITHVLF